ncbi:MAG: RecX family transcriptional regulator [Candidatus Caldarchaeum sp.]
MNPKRNPSAKKNNARTPLKEEDKRALALLLKRLRLRDAFEAELRHYAHTKNCPPNAIDSALDVLKTKKLINDFRLACHLAEAWTEKKLWAPARIAQELKARGASDEAVATALSLLPEESLTAKKLLKKLKGIPLASIARRLAQYGYSEECIQDILNPFLNE